MTRYLAFCKIIECGSFTKAAESLGYTQAAVSQMIRSLENEFSLTLLVRTRTGVRLTPAGASLYPIIERFVTVYRELKEKAGEINGLDIGELRIGTFSSISQRLLPGLMSDFGTLYPKINFVLSQGDNTSMPEWLRNGVIDIGFIYPEAAEGLEKIPFVQDDYWAVLPENHPYASEKQIPFAKMSEEPLIVVDEGDHNTVLRVFAEQGLSPRIKYRIHDDNTVLSMVEKGIGVSIMPSMILERSNYKVRTVLLDIPVHRNVAIAFRDRAMLSVAAKRFITFALDHVGKYLPPENLILHTEIPSV